MAYIEIREIQNPDSNNWEIKTQIHEKSKPTQTHENQPKNREIKTAHTHEKSTQRTENS